MYDNDNDLMKETYTEMYDDQVADNDGPVSDPNRISTWLMNSITHKVKVHTEFGYRIGFLTMDRGIFIVSDTKKAGASSSSGQTKFTTNRIEYVEEDSDNTLNISLK